MVEDPINYKECWEKAGLDIHILVFASSDFIVFLGLEFDVDWQSTPAYDKILAPQSAPQAKVLNQVASLLSVPVNELTSANKLNFRKMVAEALARCLDQDCPSANSMLKDAEDFVIARNQEVARLWYLKGAFLSALVPTLCCAIFWFGRETLRRLLGAFAVNVMLGCSMGGLGALLSVITRVSKIPVDPSAGPNLHYWEAFSRILTGMLSALCIQIAIKLNLLLPIFNSYGVSGNLFAGFLAGACEHLVSNFIKRFEASAMKSASKK